MKAVCFNIDPEGRVIRGDRSGKGVLLGNGYFQLQKTNRKNLSFSQIRNMIHPPLRKLLRSMKFHSCMFVRWYNIKNVQLNLIHTRVDPKVTGLKGFPWVDENEIFFSCGGDVVKVVCTLRDRLRCSAKRCNFWSAPDCPKKWTRRISSSELSSNSWRRREFRRRRSMAAWRKFMASGLSLIREWHSGPQKFAEDENRFKTSRDRGDQ
jgi:hypothetical protein